MNTIRFLYITSLIISPLISYAQVEISEIMYDHEGTDSGNEWVEIHNTSSSAINLEDWSFRENEVNHGLQFPGTSTINPDARMVIVQNTDQFSAEYGTTIDTIKSSFSLNNTGEVLELVNASGEVVDSHRYSSETGAQGDGTSLQLVANQWVTGTPTPGSANQTSPQGGTEEEPETTETPSDTSDTIVEDDVRKKKEKFQDYYEPYITFPEVIVAHSGERFQAGVFHVKEHSRVHKLKGVYYLNYGDGTVIESSERIDEVHRYPAAGSYMVTFEYYTSVLQYRHGEPELIYQKAIQVVPPSITISGSDTEGGIKITNTGSKGIDVSGWMIQGGASPYTFPRQSIILPSSTIVVSHKSLGYWVDETVLTKLYLSNDLNLLIHRYEAPAVEQKELTVQPDSTSDIELGENTLYLEDTKEFELANHPQETPQSGHVYEYASEKSTEHETVQHQYLVIAFGSLVVVTGVSRYLYTRGRRYRKRRYVQEGKRGE